MRSVAVLALCLLACDSSEGQPPSSSSTSSGGTSSGGTSSGGSGDTPGPERFTPAPKAKRGAVNVFVQPDMPGGPPKLGVAGYFLDYSTSNGHVPDGYSRGKSRATECTKRVSGACDLVKCQLTPDPEFTFASAKYVSAGEMTITRSTGGPAVKIAPDAEGNTYLASAGDSPPVSAGEIVTIAVAGADVAAFSESVAFIGVVTPIDQETTATTADVDVAWSGGAGPGKLVMSGETGSEEAGFAAVLTCRFDIAANRGTIPIDVLADVRGNRFGMVLVPEATTKDLGGFEVELLAETSDDPPANSFALVVAQ